MTKKPKLRTAENADRICELLAEGHTLRQIARELGCDNSAIVHWVREDSEGGGAFTQRYARAIELRCERMAEEILEISDDGSNDWMEREGLIVPDHENVQRSRLRVDARKWLLSKMLPKKYGDRITQEITGDPDAPLVTRIELVPIASPSRPGALPALEEDGGEAVAPLRAGKSVGRFAGENAAATHRVVDKIWND